MNLFNQNDLKKLYKPPFDSSKNENGLITIIGGSKLFHGAPLMSLIAASRVVDMVFFTSPEPSIGEIANQIKSKLFSFIWVPWDEVGEYIKKSDSVLIGPGLMRFASEAQMSNDKWPMTNLDSVGEETREITRDLLLKYPDKKWVIDAGGLQVLDASWIPENSILTPNKREYEMMFNDKLQTTNAKSSEENIKKVQENAKKHKCIIVLKGPETLVVSSTDVVKVKGGNPGLTKGGSGDVEAGLTAALLAKNDPFLAASSASFIVKKTADNLFQEVGTNYNSDDLAGSIFKTLKNLI